jgi:hypothetical protein
MNELRKLRESSLFSVYQDNCLLVARNGRFSGQDSSENRPFHETSKSGLFCATVVSTSYLQWKRVRGSPAVYLGGRSNKAVLYRKVESCDRVTKRITSPRCIDRHKREAFHTRQPNPLGWLRPLSISFCFRESHCSSLSHESGRASRDQSHLLRRGL